MANMRHISKNERQKLNSGKSKKYKFPIKHWSYSSLLSYLRNPLAWHKRYVEGIRDTPSTPSSCIGRAGHVALQHFYGGLGVDASIALGLESLRNIADFEVNFGVAKTVRERKEKRASMEREYMIAINHYLLKPPRYKVLGIEYSGLADVGLLLPIKAISDLVVESKGNPGAVDIVDHKFVASFSGMGKEKALFMLQAIFNYYTVHEAFKKPVKRFILQECRKKRNADGSPQMRKYVIEFEKNQEEFQTFHRLLKEATEDIATRKHFLPNPSDMFDGENSYDIYRLGL